MSLQQQIILQAINQKIKTKTNFDRLKQAVSSKSKKSQPSNQSLLKEYRKLLKNKKITANPPLEKILKTREIRTLSGVAVITVLTKPFPCPGACIYCPNDPKMPKSYLPNEPAAARALSLKFNPYTQVKKRIEMLEVNGHKTDKIELIVKGGTWSAYPKKYQDWFIKRCFEAANEMREITKLSKKQKNALPIIFPNGKIIGKVKSLTETQKINEGAKNRIVGLTLETRPDFITPEEIKHLRELGCTRIELGVQTIDDKILTLIRRGHTAEDVAKATELLRNAGFKVDYHLMPALPGVSPKKDLENFKKIFSDPHFRPDMIKIYPCSIIPKTALYNLWKQGKYKPLSTKQLLDLIIKMKLAVPPYARISRVIRDIPGDDISAGNTVTSLRQNIQAEMKRRGLKCKCIRCREVGHIKILDLRFQISDLKTFKTEYETIGGTEYFLSIESPKRDMLFAFCRLRLPQKQKNTLPIIFPNGKFIGKNIFPELEGAALIRELHTYGHLVPIDEKIAGASQPRRISKEPYRAQHFGFGKKLMREAEKIARQAGYKKMAVIAGIGVRKYYKKLKFGQRNTYMVKNI